MNSKKKRKYEFIWIVKVLKAFSHPHAQAGEATQHVHCLCPCQPRDAFLMLVSGTDIFPVFLTSNSFLSTKEFILMNSSVAEDSWESPGQQGDQTNQGNQHWIFTGTKNWCWSWSSNTLATWCEELTHWKRPWCWERLKVGGEGGDRGWVGWMASPWWTWVWASSGSWWWTGKPGVLQSMGSQSWTRLSSWVTTKLHFHLDLPFHLHQHSWHTLFLKYPLFKHWYFRYFTSELFS